jgi:hypothetical protein
MKRRGAVVASLIASNVIIPFGKESQLRPLFNAAKTLAQTILI